LSSKTARIAFAASSVCLTAAFVASLISVKFAHASEVSEGTEASGISRSSGLSGAALARENPELLSTLLGIQGFRCDPPQAPAQKAGKAGPITCIGTIDGYPRDVAIIIPPAYHPKARADLILHIHGFNLDNHPLSYMLTHFAYAQGLMQSGRDAVLVVPLSYGRCDDFNQSLADSPAHFRAFVDHAMAAIQGAGLASTADPASITLTGHSGAYYPLGAIIQNGVYTDRVNELYLLDATYGRAEDFAKYAEDTHHRFWSAYHTYDPSMNEVNPEIMADLKQKGLVYYDAPTANVSEQGIRANRVGFVVSDVDHDSTSVKYFEQFLAVPPL